MNSLGGHISYRINPFSILSIGLIAVLSALNPIQTWAQASFEEENFTSETATLPYQILKPERFDKNQKYPLVLFLHGAGERGSDNKKQLVHGSKLFLDEKNREAFPAIVVFPQCPKEDYWSNVKIEYDQLGRKFLFQDLGDPTQSMSTLLELIDSLVQQKFVDKNRIYVAGLSMGGMGTFELLARKPDLFAAAIPICGGGNPNSAKRYANNVNLWVFHGAKDDVVFPGHSVEMVLALKKAGGDPKFNLYKTANHNSWDRAFAEPDLLPWLFSQSKNN